MAHFAKIDSNNIVTQVLVVPDEQEHRGQDFLANDLGLGGTWLRTSYNSVGNVHYGPDGQPDGKPAFRKNYAGVGYSYDIEKDAFIPPCPEPDYWVLNPDTCLWETSIPYPTDGKPYFWSFTEHTWIEAPVPNS